MRREERERRENPIKKGRQHGPLQHGFAINGDGRR